MFWNSSSTRIEDTGEDAPMAGDKTYEFVKMGSNALIILFEGKRNRPAGANQVLRYFISDMLHLQLLAMSTGWERHSLQLLLPAGVSPDWKPSLVAVLEAWELEPASDGHKCFEIVTSQGSYGTDTGSAMTEEGKRRRQLWPAAVKAFR